MGIFSEGAFFHIALLVECFSSSKYPETLLTVLTSLFNEIVASQQESGCPSLTSCSIKSGLSPDPVEQLQLVNFRYLITVHLPYGTFSSGASATRSSIPLEERGGTSLLFRAFRTYKFKSKHLASKSQIICHEQSREVSLNL
jgi:hypothetical protein